MNVKWFPAAERDINGIYEYYATKSQRVATDLYNSILDDVDRLEINPYIAAIEPLLDENPKSYRSLITGKRKIKIVYYVENETVFISRIWDCRQNPKKLKNSIK